MLVEVVHVFDQPVVHGSAQTNVIPHLEMLHVFTEPDAARMGAHGDAELRR